SRSIRWSDPSDQPMAARARKDWSGSFLSMGREIRYFVLANAAGAGEGVTYSIFWYVITPFAGSLTSPVDDLVNVYPYFPVTLTWASSAGSGKGTSTFQMSSLTRSFAGSFTSFRSL